MFEFWHYLDGCWLLLLIGPGSEETRHKLYDVVRSNTDVFELPDNLGSNWVSIFSRTLLEEHLHEEVSSDELEKEIRKRLAGLPRRSRITPGADFGKAKGY